MVILMILFGFFRCRTVPDPCGCIPDSDHADSKGNVGCGAVRKESRENSGYVDYGRRCGIIKISANEPA